MILVVKQIPKQAVITGLASISLLLVMNPKLRLKIMSLVSSASEKMSIDILQITEITFEYYIAHEESQEKALGYLKKIEESTSKRALETTITFALFKNEELYDQTCY